MRGNAGKEDGRNVEEEVDEEQDLGFEDMGLDPRLLRALAKQGIFTPTPIQLKAIPLILEGKDVIARATTGSGKTFAYLLPLVQKILGQTGGMLLEGPAAIVLVPSQELCQQVHGVLSSLLERCGGPVKAVQLSRTMPVAALRAALVGPPDIVVATPARLAFCISEQILVPRVLGKSLRTLVLDEADLLLSYGYEDDLRRLAPHVPRLCQCLLMSATSSADVDKLKKLVLHNPVTLTLTEAPGSTDESVIPKSVQQFQITCKERDKLLYLLALVQLELIRKKGLFFVNSINSGFRIKLFLEQFGIRTAVLNAELPQNSRLHILQEFNAGIFDYLIATDDGTSVPGNENERRSDEKAKQEAPSSQGPIRNRRKVPVDEEFSVTRGIDFKDVHTVINYDMPRDIAAYVHRIGRTGRAGKNGIAISLVRPKEEQILNDIEVMLNGGEEVDENSRQLSEFPLLTKAAVEALRYRVEDVARHVTTVAIREARIKELRIEILNSDRLKAHFEDNPTDLELLQHDKVLSKTVPAAHLATVPGYLQDPVVEAASRSLKLADEATGQAKQKYSIRKRKRRRDDDPLQTFADHARKRRGELSGAGGATGTIGSRKKFRKGTFAGKASPPGKKKHKRRKR